MLTRKIYHRLKEGRGAFLIPVPHDKGMKRKLKFCFKQYESQMNDASCAIVSFIVIEIFRVECGTLQHPLLPLKTVEAILSRMLFLGIAVWQLNSPLIFLLAAEIFNLGLSKINLIDNFRKHTL